MGIGRGPAPDPELQAAECVERQGQHWPRVPTGDLDEPVEESPTRPVLLGPHERNRVGAQRLCARNRVDGAECPGRDPETARVVSGGVQEEIEDGAVDGDRGPRASVGPAGDPLSAAECRQRRLALAGDRRRDRCDGKETGRPTRFVHGHRQCFGDERLVGSHRLLPPPGAPVVHRGILLLGISRMNSLPIVRTVQAVSAAVPGRGGGLGERSGARRPDEEANMAAHKRCLGIDLATAALLAALVAACSSASSPAPSAAAAASASPSPATSAGPAGPSPSAVAASNQATASGTVGTGKAFVMTGVLPSFPPVVDGNLDPTTFVTSIPIDTPEVYLLYLQGAGFNGEIDATWTDTDDGTSWKEAAAPLAYPG